MKQFDAVDALTADVANAMKQHDEEFESEDQLRTWLDDAGIVCDQHTLELARPA